MGQEHFTYETVVPMPSQGQCATLLSHQHECEAGCGVSHASVTSSGIFNAGRTDEGPAPAKETLALDTASTQDPHEMTFSDD